MLFECWIKWKNNFKQFFIWWKNKKNIVLINKINISNNGFIKSKKFKKLCYKLNELISGIEKIKTTFYKKEKDSLASIKKLFSNFILRKEIILKVALQKYFESQIKETLQNKKEIEICFIYLKSGSFINDIIEDKLKKIKPNMKTICLMLMKKLQKVLLNA